MILAILLICLVLALPVAADDWESDAIYGECTFVESERGGLNLSARTILWIVGGVLIVSMVGLPLLFLKGSKRR